VTTLRSDRSRRPFTPAVNQRRRPLPRATVALSPEGVNCHLGDLCNLDDNLPPRCSLGSGRSLVGSSRWRRSCHSNRKLSDRRVVVNMPLIRPAARRAFGPQCSRRRIKSAPARAAASVQLVARASENRTRDDRPNRLGAAYAAAWVWTTHPPVGPCVSSVAFKCQHARRQLFSVSRRRPRLQSATVCLQTSTPSIHST
jgi:hypothetical protein